ncbi:hypothetical protein KDA_76060 [Dictyobacter alpinus]|uniref:Microcin J25-processing protein McjB C-terminal domain-containing protein n=1 Tax=Dictyobacter alpinus TaxID=2014873 RepID=A0A402BLB5_9CHLR|nr:lasso peptide biosynthesis protein [Dictyobacter alpinus]GCE32122.1 hypothetical protein KDA_76060 [Dictyobacter alpinus]
MGISVRNIELCPLVYYDDYDGRGLLLAIEQGLLLELNEQETQILSRLLREWRNVPLQERKGYEKEEMALLERLRGHQLITQPFKHLPAHPSATPGHQALVKRPRAKNRLQERLLGAGEILAVLNRLRTDFSSAYHYLHVLQQTRNTAAIHTEHEAFQRANQEYWVYRLVTGCFERKVARLLGQTADEEGLCLVKGFALCAYLLTLGIEAQVVIARPIYGSRSSFKLHAWVEIQGKPFNEHPNIHDGFRVICAFPPF